MSKADSLKRLLLAWSRLPGDVKEVVLLKKGKVLAHEYLESLTRSAHLSMAPLDGLVKVVSFVYYIVHGTPTVGIS